MEQLLSRKKPEAINTDKWVDHYGQKLYAFAFMRLQNPQQAEDFVQETFLTALKTKHTCDGSSDEQAWLTGIMKEKILDHFRAYFRKNPFFDMQENEDVISLFFDHKERYKKLPPGAKFAAGEAVAKKMSGPIFLSCLQQLPEAVREAFYLREIEKMKATEICEVLNVSLETFHAMLQRARLQMSYSLEPYLTRYD